MNGASFDLRRGLRAGVIAGAAGFMLWFAVCYGGSTLPAATDVSMCWAFRPWWRLSNWVSSLVVGSVIGMIAGLLTAFRPHR